MTVRINRTVGFTPRQIAFVNSEASRLNITMGEMLRRCIDYYIDAQADRAAVRAMKVQEHHQEAA